MPEVEIEVKHNGPYRIRGPVRVIDDDGQAYELSGRIVEGKLHGADTDFIALCRCGGSKSKPFCDGTHKRNGFEAPERASNQTR